jgi:hypothetical protein
MTTMTTMTDPEEFATRYAAVWNEPDAAVRRKEIAGLFAPDGAHYTPTREWHGLEGLEARVAEAYEQWVRPGEYVFRSTGFAEEHHGGVRFTWEMASTSSGEAVSAASTSSCSTRPAGSSATTSSSIAETAEILGPAGSRKRLNA